MKHNPSQQLQAINFCIRYLQNSIKPNKQEKEYVQDILETIRLRIEAAMDKERGHNG